MSGWEVSLGNGATLRALHTPDRKNPYLGVQVGSTFVAHARFINEEDMTALVDALKNVMFLPITPTREDQS